MKEVQQLSLDIDSEPTSTNPTRRAPWELEDGDRLAGRRGLAMARAILARSRVAA